MNFAIYLNGEAVWRNVQCWCVDLPVRQLPTYKEMALLPRM